MSQQGGQMLAAMLQYVAKLSHAMIIRPGIYTAAAEEIILQGSMTLLAMQQMRQTC